MSASRPQMLAAVLVAAACAATRAAPVMPRVAATRAEPAPQPSPAACWGDARAADTRATWVERATTRERAALDEALGGFVSGATPVVTGTLELRAPPGTFVGGDVLTLDLLGAVHRGGRLRAVDATGRWVVELTQLPTEPGVTRVWVSPRSDSHTYAHGQCAGCVPPLGETATLTFNGDGFVGNAWHLRERVPTTVRGTLRRLPPDALSLAQVRRAAWAFSDREGVLSELRADGDGAVRPVRGVVDVPDESAPPGSTCACSRRAEYEAEWWVGARRPSRREVRGVRIGRVVARCCVTLEGRGCAPQRRCEERVETP